MTARYRRGYCFLTSTLLVLFVLFVVSLSAAEPCQSGLKPGQRPGPYSSVISTGPNRGKSHCYICETEDRPAVVIFARTLNDSLGQLTAQLDKAVAKHEKAQLRAWVTFLNDDQLSLDPKVVKWAQKYALRHVPLGVFEDAGGPPSYRLSADADVTVLLFVKQKVVANFAFREGELTEARRDEVIKALPKILPAKK
jgi:hypothetical protein